jgi:hypothetical protein
MCNPIKPTKPSPVKYSSFFSDEIKVPTVFEKPTVQMNLGNLNSADVAALKKKDPFMYYSIKEVRTAAVLNRRVDTSTFIDEPTTKDDAAAAAGPPPSKKQKQGEDGRIITRKSRMSFEVHGDLLLEEFVHELGVANAARRPEAMDADVDFSDYFALVARSRHGRE